MKAFYLFAILILVGCTKPLIIDRCEMPCEQNIACTKELRSYSARVVTKADIPAAVDSFVVVRKYDKKVVIDQHTYAEFLWTINPGQYPLFSDSELNETTRCGEDFEFKAFKDKKQIASRTYNIAHDCCHVVLVSGDTKIVVEE